MRCFIHAIQLLEFLTEFLTQRHYSLIRSCRLRLSARSERSLDIIGFSKFLIKSFNLNKLIKTYCLYGLIQIKRGDSFSCLHPGILFKIDELDPLPKRPDTSCFNEEKKNISNEAHESYSKFPRLGHDQLGSMIIPEFPSTVGTPQCGLSSSSRLLDTQSLSQSVSLRHIHQSSTLIYVLRNQRFLSKRENENHRGNSSDSGSILSSCESASSQFTHVMKMICTIKNSFSCR